MPVDTIDIESWECIEEFPRHRVFITEVDGHNIRCELQLKDYLWGQLYDVSENEVISDGVISAGEEWDFDAINTWIESSLENEFEENED